MNKYRLSKCGSVQSSKIAYFPMFSFLKLQFGTKKEKKNRSKSTCHLHFTVSKVLFIKFVNSKSEQSPCPQCKAGYNIINLKIPNASDQKQLQIEKASAVNRSSLLKKPPEMS